MKIPKININKNHWVWVSLELSRRNIRELFLYISILLVIFVDLRPYTYFFRHSSPSIDQGYKNAADSNQIEAFLHFNSICIISYYLILQII